MRRGTRTKLIALMAGAIMLIGAGSAFAATNVAPDMTHGRRDMRGSTGRQHHPGFLVLGKITSTDGDTFTLATRVGEIKVHVDDHTTFKNGNRHDLDKGKVVAVAGKRKDRDHIDATLIAFIKHVRGRR